MKAKLIAAATAFSTVLAWGFVRHIAHPEWHTDAAVLISEPAPKPSPRQVVAARASRNGWNTGREWFCLTEIIRRESNFRPTAYNRTPVGPKKLHAGGMFQILGLDPHTPVVRQADLGIRYIIGRYGSPCHALAFHSAKGWY